MSLTVIDEDEGFDKLRGPWQALEYMSGAGTFQSWQVNREWWALHRQRDSAGRLHLLCYWQGKALAMILPTWIDGAGTLSFLQTGSSDSLDALCISAIEAQAAVAAIATHLQTSPEIACVRLTNIPRASVLLDFLPYHYKKTPYLIFQSDTISRIDVDLLDARRVLRHIGSKRANDLRNIRDRLETHFDVLDNASHPFPADQIAELLEKMEHVGQRQAGAYDTLLPFCASLYRHGLLRFARQSIDDRVVAMSALVVYSPAEYLVWLDFYDPGIKNINLKNYVDVLGLAHRDRKSLNLGTGAYPYKVRNFAPNLASLYTFHHERSRSRFVYYHFRKAVAKSLGRV